MTPENHHNQKLSDEIVVVVTNYDFSEHADHLTLAFRRYFHTRLIDAQSPNPPLLRDLSISNTYYPGLWNASVEYAISCQRKWLMFVASDLSIPDVDMLAKFACSAIANDEIGIYSPSVLKKSRCALPLLFNKGTGSIRECGVVEGFFFLAKVELLQQLFPIGEGNTYGWGVDIMSCYEAYKKRNIVVVDDRVAIYHPPSVHEHGIDCEKANYEWREYLGEKVYRWHLDIQKTLRGDARQTAV